MAYLNVVTLPEALQQMKSAFAPVDLVERLPLSQAKGRILSQTLYAEENLPAFRRSMVDGFAVKTADVSGASEQSPIVLKLLGSVQMGCETAIEVHAGTAVYIPTGGIIPAGADAMVMIEHTERLGNDVAILATPRFGEHIVSVGEDVTEGVPILEKGTRLAAQHMGILASLGFDHLPVVAPLTVTVLSTGDELVEVSDQPVLGQVRDCNRFIIESALQQCGCHIQRSKQVSDDADTLAGAIEEALGDSDLIILSGGSSAGDKDLTQRVIDQFAGDGEAPCVFIHGLAIKPGKPTIVGAVRGKPVIGLPGHPAACFMTMKALVEPFVEEWIGVKASSVKHVQCQANFQLYSASGRDVYQLVHLKQSEEGNAWVADILHGKSGMVSALAKANAYVVVPMRHEGVLPGDSLTAYLL